MKKTVQIILLLCLIPCCALAYDFKVDGVYYRITNRCKRTVEVTHWEELTAEGGKPQRVMHHHSCGCGESSDHCSKHDMRKHLKLIQMDEDAVERERTAYIGKVTIPAVVRYKGVKYKVVGVGDGSFFGRKQLTEVVLPSSITYIGEAAFENCVSLREVQLPSAVTTIGIAAFRRCLALSALTLPEGLQAIDVYAFAFCGKLARVQVPASVDTFPGNVFFHCPMLKSIYLPHTVPPVVRNDNGLTMNFRNIVFYVPADVLPLYRESAFWGKQNVQAVKQ